MPVPLVHQERSRIERWLDVAWDNLWWLIQRLPPKLRFPFIVIHSTRWIFERTRHPWRVLFRLTFPYPRYLRMPPPLSVESLVQLSAHSPDFIYERHDNINKIRNFKLFAPRDTQQYSLYRLYDAVCTQHHNEMVHEATYIWNRQEWSLADWPDPQDSDPVRYTVLAGIMEMLVEAFNWRMDLGFCRDRERYRKKTRSERCIPEGPPECVPAWAAKVPPADKRVMLFKPGTEDWMIKFALSEHLKKRNIWGCGTGEFKFV
ncbi:hypothetical protein BDZ89DRAFT_1076791 [Hymenopellis radicata]|nr:hypothetical protein BDZ89DRAFT_1076791 [Hymenopellis radicata]